MPIYRYMMCNQKRKDCFAYEQMGEGCRILIDTHFYDRVCPFYKPKEQYEREYKQSRRRMFERRKKK